MTYARIAEVIGRTEAWVKKQLRPADVRTVTISTTDDAEQSTTVDADRSRSSKRFLCGHLSAWGTLINMSRGYGAVQRRLIEIMSTDRNQAGEMSIHDAYGLACDVYGVPDGECPTDAQCRAVRRALRGLAATHPNIAPVGHYNNYFDAGRLSPPAVKWQWVTPDEKARHMARVAQHKMWHAEHKEDSQRRSEAFRKRKAEIAAERARISR